MDSKGQGISINVIIIAALALIVLVVLVVVFTGRIGVFERGVSKEGNAELNQYKSLRYGDCHPGSAEEQGFLSGFNQAGSDSEKDAARSNFESEIDRCKQSISRDECSSAGCKWK